MASPSVLAQSNGSNANTSPIITVPTGTANGDLLLATVSHVDGSTLTTPSGWTLIQRTQSTAGTGNNVQNTFWKIAASEPASYTLVLSVSEYWATSCLRITGHNSATPIHVNSSAIGSGTSVIAASVTTTLADTLLVLSLGNYGINVTAWSTPAGYTAQNNNLGWYAVEAVRTKAQAATGATGAVTTTATGAGAAGWTAQLIAVASPSAGVALIGNSVVGATGAPKASTDKGLVGSSFAASSGAIKASRGAGLVGSGALVAAGVVGPVLSAGVAGSEMAVGVGVVASGSDAGLGGVGVLMAAGAVSSIQDAFVPLVGVASGLVAGLVVPTTIKGLSGNAASASVGVVSTSRFVGLAGVQAAGVVGGVTAVADARTTLTGVVSAGMAGVPVSVVAVGLSGVAAVVQGGVIVGGVLPALVGSQASLNAGKLLLGVGVGLSGSEVTVVGGVILPQDQPISLGLTGNQASFGVGVVNPATYSLNKLGGDDVPRPSPHKGFDLKRWKKEHKAEDGLEETILAIYNKQQGIEPPAKLSQVGQLTKKDLAAAYAEQADEDEEILSLLLAL